MEITPSQAPADAGQLADAIAAKVQADILPGLGAGVADALPEAMWLAMQRLCGPCVAAQVIRNCSLSPLP